MRFVVVVFLSALLHDVSVSQQFEGVIETKNSTIDERGMPQQFTMTMYVKHDMVRIQNSAVGSSPASTMIYRGDMKVVWILDEEGKTYFEIRQDDQPQEVHSPQTTDSKPPVMKKTGKTKRVLGYTCEQIKIIDDDQLTEIWATKSLGDLFRTISQVLGSEGTGQEWENKIMKMGYYPLIASTSVGGKVMESQEVTKVEKKQLPSNLFGLPEGYTKQTNEMMR
jgi:hypothetical protein